jgi:predicted GNAT superfamily acetyltransferase
MERASGATILPHCIRVEAPIDAESLFASDLDAARRWRATVRRGLQWGLSSGYAVAAFHIDDQAHRGFYLMVKAARTSNQK